ncbi:thyrostimulin beta-5 subunit [Anabrus simplex]|uniref:thyrostimulin beta-5 subunit n=1 Tax=Anabrus simplex TaxID=316456 RepID=UPI0034DCD324
MGLRRFSHVCFMSSSLYLALVTLVWLSTDGVHSQAHNPSTTLECHMRKYNYKVTKTDSEGRLCWDYISVVSCWGRCDSNEISDWRFPYKRSFHPVCMHDARELRRTKLRNCEVDAEPGTEDYQYYEALSCRCSVCKSSEASCEGLRYRGQRSGPFTSLQNKGR